ncbi:MAG: hypothetical protein WKF37_01055 [Bryobacteraceae bacterium]
MAGRCKAAIALAGAYLGRGTQALDRNQATPAIEDLRRAAELAPADGEILMNLGRASTTQLDTRMRLQCSTGCSHNRPSFRWHDFTGAQAGSRSVRQPRQSRIYSFRSRRTRHMHRPIWCEASLISPKGRPARVAGSRQGVGGNARERAGTVRIRPGVLRSNRLAEAETLLRRAMKLDPEDAGPVNLLVGVLTRLGRQRKRRPKLQAAELAKLRRSTKPGEIRFNRVRP